jgi:hypothetical protein
VVRQIFIQRPKDRPHRDAIGTIHWLVHGQDELWPRRRPIANRDRAILIQRPKLSPHLHPSSSILRAGDERAPPWRHCRTALPRLPGTRPRFNYGLCRGEEIDPGRGSLIGNHRMEPPAHGGWRPCNVAGESPTVPQIPSIDPMPPRDCACSGKASELPPGTGTSV